MPIKPVFAPSSYPGLYSVSFAEIRIAESLYNQHSPLAEWFRPYQESGTYRLFPCPGRCYDVIVDSAMTSLITTSFRLWVNVMVRAWEWGLPGSLFNDGCILLSEPGINELNKKGIEKKTTRLQTRKPRTSPKARPGPSQTQRTAHQTFSSTLALVNRTMFQFPQMLKPFPIQCRF